MKGQVNQKPVDAKTIQNLIEEFKRLIMKRGAKGIIGLQRVFKICDDDKSGNLNRPEFFKALREYKMEVTDEQVNLMFNVFDGDRSGNITYDEFLYVIKGEMSEKRKALV